MSPIWLNDLKSLGTNWKKEHITEAPWIIIVFKESYTLDDNNKKKGNYYQTESVGISCGFLISAIHQSGLVTLTHTPSPMRFLRELCERPKNEVPFLLLPVGYPSEDATVPNLKRKDLSQVLILKE